MRILIATPLLASQPGGPGQYAHNLASAFRAGGHHVDTIAFSEVAGFPSGIRHFLLFLKACRKVHRTDGVIVLDTVSVGLPLTLAAALFRKKIIIRVGGDFVWEHYIERTGDAIPLSKFYDSRPRFSLKERAALLLQRHVIIPLSSAVVFSTDWQRRIWEEPYGLRRIQTTIVENAYAPTVSGKERHTGASNQIVWVGRDIVLKNVRGLERAIEVVRREHPDMTLRKCSGLSHDEVLHVLAESRVLVIPSISEVSPNVVLEALALGTPVILTKECGIRNVLDTVVVWIDPENIEDIARQIGSLMTEDGYAEALARTRSFTSDRTYETVAQEFLPLLTPGNSRMLDT